MSVLMLEKRPDIGSPPVRCGEGISRDWLGELGITPSDRWVDNEVKGGPGYSGQAETTTYLCPRPWPGTRWATS